MFKTFLYQVFFLEVAGCLIFAVILMTEGMKGPQAPAPAPQTQSATQ